MPISFMGPSALILVLIESVFEATLLITHQIGVLMRYCGTPLTSPHFICLKNSGSSAEHLTSDKKVRVKGLYR